MKVFVTLALALAAAQADPQYFYNGFNAFHHAAPAAYYTSPFTYALKPVELKGDEEQKVELKKGDEEQKVEFQYTMPYTYTYGYPYAHAAYHTIAKRDAEAEADPAFFYNAYQPYAYNHFGYNQAFGYNSAPYTAAYSTYAHAAPAVYAHAPVTYKLAPRYHAKSAGGIEHIVAKRDAEADPAFFYNAYQPYAYNHAFGYNYAPYTAAYTTYAHAAPSVYAHAPVTYKLAPRYHAKSAENVEHVVY